MLDEQTVTQPAQVAIENSNPAAPVPPRKLTLEQWAVIEAACTNVDVPMSFADAEKEFGVSQKTIAKRAKRHSWAVPRVIAKTIEGQLQTAVAKVAANWANRGERHREVAFHVAHESVKKFKPKAPKNFRELEAADKVARRAAGLEVAEINQQTLININEAIDAHVVPVRDAQDAEVLPTPSNAVENDSTQGEEEQRRDSLADVGNEPAEQPQEQANADA